MIPYWRNEENKELYKETKTFVGRRCLILKNIPQVLDNFLRVHTSGISNLDFHPEGDQGI